MKKMDGASVWIAKVLDNKVYRFQVLYGKAHFLLGKFHVLSAILVNFLKCDFFWSKHYIFFFAKLFF